MPETAPLTTEQVKRAIEEIRCLKPGYEDILAFYGEIFMAQEDCLNRISIEPAQLPGHHLPMKSREGFPVMDPSQFAVDVQACGELLNKICSIITRYAQGDAPRAARELMNAFDEKRLDLKALYAHFLDGDEGYYEDLAAGMGVSEGVLLFVANNSVKPSLVACARHASNSLEEGLRWTKGYCPICGGQPVLSMFHGEGERLLVCGFCWHQWSVSRMYCPFCNNTDAKRLGYFEIEQAEEHRIDVCNVCKKYIKTVDTRKLGRIVYPPAECISTLDLDLKARELGFESEASPFLEV